MPSDFVRPKSGFRYDFLGVSTASTPDALPPGKHPIAVNIRGYTGNQVVSRPGQLLKFTTGGHAVTDLCSYVTLNTDELPRYLARDTQDKIWLDTGVQVGTLSAGGLGAAMLAVRPNQSPVPYIYVANGADYQKFSAPTVAQQKVGIAEPQSAPDLGVAGPYVSDGSAVAALWTFAGTAGMPSDGNRLVDAVIAVAQDPIDLITWSLQISDLSTMGRGATVFVAGDPFVVQDIIQGTPQVNTASIQYYSGTTGRCVIVPTTLPNSFDIAAIVETTPVLSSINTPAALATIRRGALVQLDAEVCYVLSVSSGPNNQISIETSTTIAHANPTFQILPTVVVRGFGTPAIAATFTSVEVTGSTTGAGIGTYTLPELFFGSYITQQPLQVDDYLHISLLFDHPEDVTELRLQFDVGDGSFSSEYFYYSLRSNDLMDAILATTTQLAAAQTISQRAAIDDLTIAESDNQGLSASSGQLAPSSNQWMEIQFPISSLTRVGTNNHPLSSTVAIQVWINASAAINIEFGSITVAGGGQPDVGDVGSPYFYRVRPRSALTGARGNPSPSTRYGVSPRRAPVTVKLPSASYDTQIDTWDIERYGGSVTSWRYIGSTASGSATFTDNYTDEAAQVGELLDFDNFEPWPSIDVPFLSTATKVTGTIALITLGAATAANVVRYLPGNLIQIGGQNVYTLRSRPVLVSGTTYRFEFEECAGASTTTPVSIYEPALANQPLPYMFGPDAAGTVFAVGDPLRPGTLYFAKNYAPDQAPDAYNIEITPPSEPLLGGEIMDGLAFVASPERWWALYPQPDNPAQRFNYVQQPFTRGLAAPYGHCTDGASLYWWAKDSIQSSSKGSLTDEDLYNLFPHDGVVGSNYTYNGKTLYAPDYSRAGTFRLTYANSYLYATYQDSTGTYRQLVLDTRRGSWSVDEYDTAVCCFYHPQQPAGTLLTSTTRYDELVMANMTGVVSTQKENRNDLSGPIDCTIATAEYDGGDLRAPKQWGDIFLDLIPAADAGVIATPMSLGTSVAASTTIAATTTRTRTPISVGGIVVSDFMGLLLTWTDDFDHQSQPTQIFTWNPSFDIQPASTIGWATFGTSFGQSGYMHIREVVVAYVSTAAITLTIVSYDGQSPVAITLPSTGGAYKKVVFPLTANKGQLYKFQATSTATFQIFEDDCEVRVGPWNRQSAYSIYKQLGGPNVASAPV